MELESLLKIYIVSKLGLDLAEVQGPLTKNIQWLNNPEKEYSSYLEVFRYALFLITHVLLSHSIFPLLLRY